MKSILLLSVVKAQYSECLVDDRLTNYLTTTYPNAFDCFKECEANVKANFNYCCQYSVESTECLLSGIENSYDTFDIDPRVLVVDETLPASYAIWY